jgi:hypothetical protein
MNDLQAGSGHKHARVPFGAANDHSIQLDSDPGRPESEGGQKTSHCLSVGDLARFAIYDHFHHVRLSGTGANRAQQVDTPFG